jgi:hypothetical protein
MEREPVEERDFVTDTLQSMQRREREGKMPTVSHVIDRKLGIDYGFLYEIKTPEELHDYWCFVAQPRWSKGFSELMTMKEFSHPATAEGSMLQVLSEARGIAPLLVMGSMTEKAYLAMSRCLSGGPIVINRNGGFFPLAGQEVKDRRKVDLWTLPGAQIKISQWPNGTHFYARVGDEDVEESGRRKWDTRDAAERAAKRFAKEKSIHLSTETDVNP